MFVNSCWEDKKKIVKFVEKCLQLQIVTQNASNFTK